MRKTINVRNKTRLITVINSLIFVIPYIYNTKHCFYGTPFVDIRNKANIAIQT